MKNIFNRFVFLIAFCGLFVSCSNFSTSFYNEVDISKGKGKICISTDLQASRSVLPTAITDTTTGLKWELNGTKDDTTKTIKSWVDDTNGTTAYKKMVADTSIFIDVGEWKFTLTANNTAGKNVLNATISVTINAGENSLNFEMQEAIGENAATGSIEFTLNFPKKVVDNAIATLCEYGNDNTAVDTNRQLTIDDKSSDDFDSVKYSYPNSTTAELKSGYYILKIELQQSNGSTTAPTTINTYSCLVRVAPGLTSKGEYTLDKLAQLYTVTYKVDEGIFDSATTVTTSYNEYTTFALPTINEKDGYEYQWYKTVYDIYSNSSSQEPVDDPSNVSITEDTTFGVKCYKIVDKKDIVRTAKGDSTGDYFSIGTAEGLAIFRDLVNGCDENLKMVDNSGKSEDGYVYYGLVNYKSQLNAKLTSDIDLTQLKDADGNELSWVPINGYSGTFDGGGYTITVNNTYQVNGNLYYQGFFDTLDGATIKNLVVAGEETISESGLVYCGGIASQIKNQRGVNTTFENCVNKRNITVSADVKRIGGFAGYTSSSTDVETNFVNCINLGTIENNYNASEYYEPYVAGFTSGATSYKKCINAGNVTGASYLYNSDDAASGTVAGFDASVFASFTNCINLGNISANSYPFSDGKFYPTEKVYGFSSIESDNFPTFTNCIDAGSANCPFTGVVDNITGTYDKSYYNSDSYGSSYNADYAKTSDDLCKQEKTNFSNWSYDSSNSRYPLPNITEGVSSEIWQEVEAKAIPKVSNFEMLKNRITSANGTAENLIVLNGNIDIAETLEITTPIKIIASTSAGVTITRGLDGSGSASAFTGAFFDNQSTLTLEGITLDGAKNSSIEATAPLITSSGNLTLNNCTLQNNTNNTGNGGGVYVANKAIFTMGNGATISNCTGYNGGGVYVSGGTFTMNGGAISDCIAEQGGGVYVSGGTFTMENNSLISKNTSGGNGGGIFADGGSITIKGGSISENTIENGYSGGGIYLTNSATLEMSGGEISRNCLQNTDPSNGTNGGGVMVSEATFTMTGGEISGNSAYYGGGVAVDGSFFMSGGTISGNKVTNNSNGNGNGSGVYVAYSGNSQLAATFEMSGGAVISLDNDVYLAKEASIKVTGNLTGTTPVATITPNEYSTTWQVITVPGSADGTNSSVTLSDQVGKFAVTPQTATDGATINWYINAEGKIAKENAYYVSNIGSDNEGVTGSKDAPFATLQAAVDMVNSINDGASPYTIYVMNNINLGDDSSGTTSSAFINIAPEKSLKLKICGCGDNIEIDAQQKGSVMYIANNDNSYTAKTIITLENVTLTGGKSTGAGGVTVFTGGELIMNSGATIKNCIGDYGGGVIVYTGGTFTMNDKSTISECTSLSYGGGVTVYGSDNGVQVSGGTFNMAGGTISGCTAEQGGGVYVEKGTFTMSGGAYVNYSNNDVYLANGTTITVTGNLTSTDTVATITPDEYSATRQVLVAGSGVALSSSLVKQFNVTPDNNGNEWFIDPYGYLGKVPETGTNDDGAAIYLMESYDNLLYIAQELKTGSITSFNMKLTNDIEIPSGKWTSPLDVTNASTIDGQGHSIKFNGGSGLFERFHEGSIENLVLEGTINTSSYQNHHNGHCGVGVLAGSAYKTTIKNVVSTVYVVDTGDGYVGGLIGYFGGNSNVDEYQPGSFIQNCAVYANIKSTNGTVGGLVGGTWANAQCWQINNCIYAGTVDGGTDQGVGAIIGTHNTGRTSTFKDTWYYANGTSKIVGKYNNGENFNGYETVISKNAEEITSEAAATLLGDAWKYVSGGYPTLKSVN